MNKQELNKTYYQTHKERIKARRQARYENRKQAKKVSPNYYEAESIRILMSLKDYTELNQPKHKLWLNFIWTFKDLNKTGFYNIIQIMKFRAEADNLIRDYWTTAKQELRKGKNWNSLDYDQQQKLIKHWGYEKARIENNYLDIAEQLETQGKTYEKEIELAKYHEERGKIKCECWQCENKKVIQQEVKKKVKKEIDKAGKENDRKWGVSEKEQCPQCRKLRELDEVSGLCESCAEQYD